MAVRAVGVYFLVIEADGLIEKRRFVIPPPTD